MTDFDLEHLGDVWRQRPTPEEMEGLHRTAERVSRRARWAQMIDAVSAVVVAGVVLVLVASNPELDTVLVGGGAILVLLVSNLRLRRVRQIELRSLTGSTEEMLDQAVRRIEKTLRYQYFSLAAIGPGFAIGYWVASSTGRATGPVVDFLRNIPALGPAWTWIWLAVFAGIVLFVLLSIRRSRRELARLNALREAYRVEDESILP